MKHFRSTKYFAFVIVVLFVFMSCVGCKKGETAEEIESRVQASLAAQAIETSVAATLEAEEVANVPPATDAPMPTDAVPPTDNPEPLPTVTLTPTVEHLMIPDEPQGAQSSLTDISTAPLAEEGVSIGDSYLTNLYERPFTTEQMEYRGYLDIVYTSLIVDSTWIYAIIYLEEELPETANANYGIEFDLDMDGRGDWLVLAALPLNSEWTTDGVGVYHDKDGDVGAATPLRPDAPVPSQNGYEEKVFLSGQGADPDAAWTRRDPQEPNRVQIALKVSLFDTAQGFLWGIWANEGNENPNWFDYNDHFTLEEAGSPADGNDEYPLKALYLLDSTCRSWFGFDPVGNEPGMCGMLSTETNVPDSNLGWCEQAYTHMGCASPCYEQCPQGKTCMACVLP